MNESTLISIVVPVFNEGKILELFVKELSDITKKLNYDFEFIFVNDGSTDGSLDLLLKIREKDKRVKIIDLSRNFGHQYALTAGLDFAKGNAVLMMDSDMEDPPSSIPLFLEKWAKGHDVVYAIRTKRKVGLFKNIAFYLFHKINKMIFDGEISPSGIFALMDRKVVNHLKFMREQNRYIPGLRAWTGFKQVGIEIERGKRHDGNPRVSVIKLIKLAFDSYISFSKIPLKFASFMGIFFSVISFFSIILVLILKLTIGFDVQGWASMIMVVLFIGGIQLITIGIIGEYIGRILDETKGRPLYIVNNMYGFEDTDQQ